MTLRGMNAANPRILQLVGGLQAPVHPAEPLRDPGNLLGHFRDRQDLAHHQR